jgi:hypothetical protein
VCTWWVKFYFYAQFPKTFLGGGLDFEVGLGWVGVGVVVQKYAHVCYHRGETASSRNRQNNPIFINPVAGSILRALLIAS